jgi:hypothetical protein
MLDTTIFQQAFGCRKWADLVGEHTAIDGPQEIQRPITSAISGAA